MSISAYASNPAAMAGLIDYLRGFAKDKDLFSKTEDVVANARATLAERGKEIFGEDKFKMSFGTTEAYNDLLYGENSPEREQQLLNEDLALRQSDAIYGAVVNAFASDKGLHKQMQATVKKIMAESPIVPKGVATYVALHDTIIDNRDAFPPEEFVMRVDYWFNEADQGKPGAANSLYITIPSLKMVNAMKFAERNAEKERVYFQAIADAEKNAALGKDVTALDAMKKALKTLLDNQPVEDLFNQPKADEETLAKPYLESALSVSTLKKSQEILTAFGQQ